VASDNHLMMHRHHQRDPPRVGRVRAWSGDVRDWSAEQNGDRTSGTGTSSRDCECFGCDAEGWMRWKRIARNICNGTAKRNEVHGRARRAGVDLPVRQYACANAGLDSLTVETPCHSTNMCIYPCCSTECSDIGVYCSADGVANARRDSAALLLSYLLWWSWLTRRRPSVDR
jgi:hypothetical protein